MSKRWDDDEDGEAENTGDNDFWMEFNGQDAANMLEVNRQQEFDVAHKQLNMEILEKAIKMAKGRWIWWIFASNKSRVKSVRFAYRNMLHMVENSL